MKKGGFVAGRIWDVSQPLDESTPVYPGLPLVEVTWLRTWEAGSTCSLSKVAMCSHAGTHVDAPYHYVPDGCRLGEVPLDRFVGPARVVDVSGFPGQALDARSLVESGLTSGIVLIKTRGPAPQAVSANSPLPAKVYLSPSAAEAVLQHGVTTLGIDSLSVDPPRAAAKPAHQLLLGAGVIVFEGLNLCAVPAGDYFFVGLPLRFDGLEAAPARAILLEPTPGS